MCSGCFSLVFSSVASLLSSVQKANSSRSVFAFGSSALQQLQEEKHYQHGYKMYKPQALSDLWRLQQREEEKKKKRKKE